MTKCHDIRYGAIACDALVLGLSLWCAVMPAPRGLMSGVRSAHAADFATSKGLKNVFNLVGGVLAWGKAGYTFSVKK